MITAIDKQVPEIIASMRLDAGEGGQVAGDQGMVFGFACDETPEMMPLPISLAHRLARRLDEVRVSGEIPYLGPDGKSQATVIYEGLRPVGLDTVVIAAQHRRGITRHQIVADIKDHVVDAVIPEQFRGDHNLKVNEAGEFTIGKTLAMVQHRSSAALSAFLMQQGHRWCKGVKVVVSDGSKAYKSAIDTHLGPARHVLDRFHVIRWFSAGLTQVRRDIQRRPEGSKPAFDPEVFRARFALLRRGDTLTDTIPRFRRRAKLWEDTLVRRIRLSAGPSWSGWPVRRAGRCRC